MFKMYTICCLTVSRYLLSPDAVMPFTVSMGCRISAAYFFSQYLGDLLTRGPKNSPRPASNIYRA